MRASFKWLLSLVLLLMVAATAMGIYSWRWLHDTPVITQDMVYEVPKGAALSVVARDLHARGLLQHPRIWSWWARKRALAGALKAGEYALKPGLTPDALLNVLTSGGVILHSMTFVEGSTFAQLRHALRDRRDIVHITANLPDAELMQRLNLGNQHPEGRFFPDTYQFPKGTSDLELLAMAQRRMQRELDSAWAARSDNLILRDPYEALILASIVEKETALGSERPLIAGVFLRRLELGMRLQTDPTVIYGMGASYDGDIRRADLQRDTPYNTYTRTGLPPTPICLPGAAALRAAVNPQRSGALYFVASGKGDGSHYFSSNLVEHNLAVQRYLKMLRAKN